MTTSTRKTISVVGFALLGIGLLALSIYIAEIDDAPGVALMGFVLMMVSMTAAVKTARKRE